MKYVWTYHAASERLSERSGLTKSQIEDALNERRYVVGDAYRNQEHHLIWDEVRKCLIDVPVTLSDERVIPSILPVTYGSNYAEWQRAEAEQVWRGEDYYKPSFSPGADKLGVVEVWLAKRWFTLSGWGRNKDLVPILTWFIFDPEIARTGDEGMLALFCEQSFRHEVKRLLEEWMSQLEALVDGDEPVVHIKKPGAHRLVPVKFFLATP